MRVSSPRSPWVFAIRYKIDAKLDASRHTIAATETLTWTNGGHDAVDTLPFHLYLNAFKNESSLFMRSSHGEMRGARASEGGWGWIDVHSLTIDGVAYQLRFPDNLDQTVAEVKLASPIQPGQAVTIDVAFDDQLPEVFARTGYKGDFHMVGQWFPQDRRARRARPAPSARAGRVRAAVDQHRVLRRLRRLRRQPHPCAVDPSAVAATGVLVVVGGMSPGGTRTFRYHAEDVHDFKAWMADPLHGTSVRGTAKLGDGGPDVEVRVYFRGEQRAFRAAPPRRGDRDRSSG